MNFTLEESTTEQVPPILEKIVKILLSECKANDSIQKDLFFILILVMMLENEFNPLDGDLVIVNGENIDIEHLKHWKLSSGVFETRFLKNGFENIKLKLAMTPLGATALVNVVISDLDLETYSLCLPVSRYVVSPSASSIPMIFRDLKHLSITFKNGIISPVKSRILSYCGFPSGSLLGLPEEVFYKIILHLPVKAVLNLSETCKKLDALIQNNSLWHKLFMRDFPNDLSDQITDWKEKYQDIYAIHQRELLRQRRSYDTMHDILNHSNHISFIDNPMWDLVL